MAANEISPRLIRVCVAASAVLVWACADLGSDDAGATDDPLTGELLADVATDAIAPSYEAFAAAAEGLATATAQHAVALDAESLEAARDAWRDAMLAWQVVEPMQLGPAGPAGVRIGGENLRDEVYSWPSTNTCRVDQELVLGEYDSPDFFETRLVNAYGLDALEYLLFYEGTDNTCAPQLPINAEGQWEALNVDELAQRRADYAAAAAAGLADTADTLAAAWGSDGPWTEHLRTAGKAGSAYGSQAEALDEVFAAMFYADKQLKDAKLARPAGILDCSAETCPADLEFQYATMSKEAAVANAEGIVRLYFGGTDREASIGFDDLLIARGADAVATELEAAMDEMGPGLDAVSGSYREALANDPSALDGPHAAVKRVTDLFKGEFSMALSLSIPQEGAGDAD